MAGCGRRADRVQNGRRAGVDYYLPRRALSRAGATAGAGRSARHFLRITRIRACPRIEDRSYRAQIQARAVENTVYVIQANAPANADATGSHGQSRLIAPDGNVIEEASIFDEDILSATLDLERATGRQAQQSVERGPLGDWWRAGVERVRVIGD
jgi:predicted amidohydrolase